MGKIVPSEPFSSDYWSCILDVQERQKLGIGWEHNIQAGAEHAAVILKGEQ